MRKLHMGMTECIIYFFYQVNRQRLTTLRKSIDLIKLVPLVVDRVSMHLWINAKNICIKFDFCWKREKKVK